MSANVFAVCVGIVLILWALDLVWALDDYIQARRGRRARDGWMDRQALRAAEERRRHAECFPYAGAGAGSR